MAGLTILDSKTFVDKSDWGDGPWQDEPDRVYWQDEATGLPCIVRRNEHFGNWCGYVGVSKHNPFFGMPYDDVTVDVHGGMTYADYCQEDDKEFGVCHVDRSDPEHRYWLGFDFAHGMDYMPGMLAIEKRSSMPPSLWERTSENHYWTLAEVQQECERAASQLKDWEDAGLAYVSGD